MWWNGLVILTNIIFFFFFFFWTNWPKYGVFDEESGVFHEREREQERKKKREYSCFRIGCDHLKVNARSRYTSTGINRIKKWAYFYAMERNTRRSDELSALRVSLFWASFMQPTFAGMYSTEHAWKQTFRDEKFESRKTKKSKSKCETKMFHSIVRVALNWMSNMRSSQQQQQQRNTTEVVVNQKKKIMRKECTRKIKSIY